MEEEDVRYLLLIYSDLEAYAKLSDEDRQADHGRLLGIHR